MKRILIITGANGFLGNYAVNYFLTKEYDFYYFISREEIKIESISKKYKTILCRDLSNETNVENSFSQINYERDDQFFLLDTIGGFLGGIKLWDYSIDEIKKIFNLNFTTAFLIAKYFSKISSKAKGGSICFISARTGVESENGKFAYGLSKNAVNYLVKSLALEGKEVNLTINAVAPYAIDNDSNREWINDVRKLNSPQSICELVFNCFENHPKISGEIFEP